MCLFRPFSFFCDLPNQASPFVIYNFPIQKNHPPFLLYLSPYYNPSTYGHILSISPPEHVVSLTVAIRGKITLPFCSTLAHIAIPRPTALGLQTAGTTEHTEGYNFSIKGKKKKENLSQSNQMHNFHNNFKFNLTLSIEKIVFSQWHITYGSRLLNKDRERKALVTNMERELSAIISWLSKSGIKVFL